MANGQGEAELSAVTTEECAVIIIARLGGIEIVCDDEMTDTRPTPECIADTAKRIVRIAVDAYIELPEGVKVQPVDGDDD